MAVADFILGLVGTVTGIGALVLQWLGPRPRVSVRMGYALLDGTQPNHYLDAISITAVNRGGMSAHVDQVDIMPELDVIDMTVNPLPGSDPTRCEIQPHNKVTWYFAVEDLLRDRPQPIRARGSVLLATGDRVSSRNSVPAPLTRGRIRLRTRLVLLRFKLRRKLARR